MRPRRHCVVAHGEKGPPVPCGQILLCFRIPNVKSEFLAYQPPISLDADAWRFRTSNDDNPSHATGCWS